MGLGRALWRTRGYLLPQLRHFLLFGALSGVGMLLELAVYLVGFDLLTNKVFRGEPLNAIQAGFLGLDGDRFVAVDALGDDARRTLRTVFLVLIGSLLAAGFLLGTALRYYLTWILQRVNQALRLAMVERAVHLSLRYHDEAPVGDAIYRVYQDSAMVTNVVQNALIQPLTALANLLVALVALTFFDPYLGLLFLFGLVPSVVAVRAFTTGLRRRSDRARRANSALTAHIQESVNGARVLKANRAEGGAFDAFRRYSHRALDRAYELRRSIAVLNLIVFLATATTVIVADYLMAGWVRTEARDLRLRLGGTGGLRSLEPGCISGGPRPPRRPVGDLRFAGDAVGRSAGHGRRPEAGVLPARFGARRRGSTGCRGHARGRGGCAFSGMWSLAIVRASRSSTVSRSPRDPARLRPSLALPVPGSRR